MAATPKQESSTSQGDFFALARVDFLVFVILLFPVLHDGKTMKLAAYVDLITHVLMRTISGGSKRIIFNLPPGHMKSLLVSVLYTAWRLGVNPNEKILCISYGDKLTHDLARKVRMVMTSQPYRAIFPGTVLDKNSEDVISTTKGGQRNCVAVGGSIAGFRADLIVIDDPMQPADAVSELAKQKLRDWYAENVAQRLLDQGQGVIILVMHRVAPDDLTATFVEAGGWYHIPLPLIAIKEEKYIDAVTNGSLLWRKPGEMLNPAWFAAEVAENLKRTLPSHIFEGQYQQNPLYGGSGMCAVGRFKRYGSPPPFDLVIHSWDLAASKDGGDWTVCAKFGLTTDANGRDHLYLLGPLIRVRVELPDVRALIVEQDRLERPALIVIDANGIGRNIYQDLVDPRRLGGPLKHILSGSHFDKTKPGDLKIRRFLQTLNYLYDGVILIPESMPGQDAFLNELAAFPGGRHDDQVDALSIIGANMPHVIRRARHFADEYGRWAPNRAQSHEEQSGPPPPRSRYFDRMS